jgi:cytochrome c oxidase subunit 2
MMVILMFILVYVRYIFIFILSRSLLDKFIFDSHSLEFTWTVLPILILLLMAFPSLYLLYLIEEFSSPLLTVKVVGHQWYWEYQFSNSWISHVFDSYIVYSNSSSPLFHALDVDNRLVLPVLSSILFLITSADVPHSWTVPCLGIKADACPGRLNYLRTISSYSGVYYGQCREICGSNHRLMPIVVEFIPMDSYLEYLSHLDV